MTQDTLFAAYVSAHPKSAELHTRAKTYFAGDGATANVRIAKPFRPFITHAKGSKKWDVDGNEYIDYTMGHGALLLGHSHPAVVAAVQEQAAKGFHYGDNHELEMQWADLIRGMVPSAERLELFSCGQEANLMAIRLARIFTGRKKILRFVENFHGWADPVVLPPSSPGVVAENITLVPYDLELAERELARGDYALVMTEGGGGHMAGQVPVDFGFVRALPDLAHRYGALWHLDEVVTGFRDDPGGFQAMVGVRPDLSSFGKIVSGGLPGGVLVGRADIFTPLGSGSPPEKRVRHSGTWNGNPVTCAAGIACLTIVKTGEPQKTANRLASAFRNRVNPVLRKEGIPARLYGRSITHVYLGPIETEPGDEIHPPTRDVDTIVGMGPEKERLAIHLLQRGIATLSARVFVMSAVHTEEDIQKTADGLIDSLRTMKAEGTIG